MEPTATYTNRTNARRAGVQSGIPSEQVELTIHKNDAGVRFGYRARTVSKASVIEKSELTTKKANPEKRNGVKCPALGGVCRAVWDWLDENPGATLKDLKAVAGAHNWNVNNVSCEFYQHRKFHRVISAEIA